MEKNSSAGRASGPAKENALPGTRWWWNLSAYSIALMTRNTQPSAMVSARNPASILRRPTCDAYTASAIVRLLEIRTAVFVPPSVTSRWRLAWAKPAGCMARATVYTMNRPPKNMISVTRNTHMPSERSEEHTSELQSLAYLVCRLLLEKKKNKRIRIASHECNEHNT